MSLAARRDSREIPHVIEVAQLWEAASRLSAPYQAELAASLLGSLDDLQDWVSDEELDLGAVRGLSLEDFRVACGR
jgi:hypothetical protein